MDKKEFFQGLADNWDQGFYSPAMIERLPALVSQFHLSPGAKVLDVGTGTGGLIPYLLERIGPQGSVWAVDFAGKMLNVAKGKFKKGERVSLTVAAVESLPFRDGFFDHVVCFGSFPHFDDQRRALREMARALPLSGTLVIAHALSSGEIRHHHQNCAPVSHDFLPEESRMKDLLAQAGFQLKELIDRPKCYVCEAVKISAGV